MIHEHLKNIWFSVLQNCTCIFANCYLDDDIFTPHLKILGRYVGHVLLDKGTSINAVNCHVTTFGLSKTKKLISLMFIYGIVHRCLIIII